MLHDLNIVWSTPSSAVGGLEAATSELIETLKFARFLGYETVAVGQTLRPPIDSKVGNSIPLIDNGQRGGACTGTGNGDGGAGVGSSTGGNTTTDLLPAQILRRATLILTEPGLNYRLQAIASAFDIVAVQPTSEATFTAACTASAGCASSAQVGLISLDMTAFTSFPMRPTACAAAVQKGLRFEICYSPLLMAPDDRTASAADRRRLRANAIGNLTALVRATRGGRRNSLVVSSGASAGHSLRGPVDVVNLLAVWGLAPDRGLDALRSSPQAVVANEALKRHSFRGVVAVTAIELADGKRKREEEVAATDVESSIVAQEHPGMLAVTNKAGTPLVHMTSPLSSTRTQKRRKCH